MDIEISSWNASDLYDLLTFDIELRYDHNVSVTTVGPLDAVQPPAVQPHGSRQARNQYGIVLLVTLSMALAGNSFMIYLLLAHRKLSQSASKQSMMLTSSVASNWRTASGQRSNNGGGGGGNGARRRQADGPRLSCVQVLLVHNCVADICFGLFALLPLLVNFYWTAGRLWGSSTLVCKLMKYATIMPMLSSPFLLVAIGIDRFQAICRPLSVLHRSTSSGRPRAFALAAWLSAAVCSTPQLLVWRVELGVCTSSDIPLASGWHAAYSIYFVLLVWFVPTVATAYCYGSVCRALYATSSGRLRLGSHASDGGGRKLASALRHTAADGERALSAGATHDYVSRLRSSGTQYKRHEELRQKKMDTIKLNVCIVLTNFILWSPHSVATIVYTVWPHWIGSGTMAVSPRILLTYAMLMGNLNSCVTPWIYVLFNWPTVKRTLGRAGRRRAASVPQRDERQAPTGQCKSGGSDSDEEAPAVRRGMSDMAPVPGRTLSAPRVVQSKQRTHSAPYRGATERAM